MPSIETITTSDILIPSRVASRDRRPMADLTIELPAPPAVAMARLPVRVAPQPPVPSYRTTDAVPLATLFNTSAPVVLDADAIEDEIAKILALLESDSTDDAPAEAVTPRLATREAPPSLPPPLPPPIASTPVSMPTAPDTFSREPVATDHTPLVATETDEPPPSPQPPVSPTDVAARLANLIADHKSLLEEFAAATEHLGVADFADDTSDPSLVATEDHAPLQVDADSAQSLAPSDTVASHEEVDVRPTIVPVAPLPAWSSAAEASRTTRRDPAVESLMRAIAVAQSYVPITPPAPPSPAKSMEPINHTSGAVMEPDRLPYAATPDTEPASLNPVPGFLGGVAVSGIVGAALWAALQA